MDTSSSVTQTENNVSLMQKTTVPVFRGGRFNSSGLLRNPKGFREIESKLSDFFNKYRKKICYTNFIRKIQMKEVEHMMKQIKRSYREIMYLIGGYYPEERSLEKQLSREVKRMLRESGQAA